MEELRLRPARHGGGYAVFEDFETLLFVGSLDECLSYIRLAFLRGEADAAAAFSDMPLSESPLFKEAEAEEGFPDFRPADEDGTGHA